MKWRRRDAACRASWREVLGRSKTARVRVGATARRAYCCGCGWTTGLAANSVAAFEETQFKRFRDSMKRPALERAPKMTTATF